MREAVVEAMIAHCRSLFERGYTCSSGGNVSHRHGDGFLMEASNTSFGRLTPADFAACTPDAAPRPGQPRPSKEAPFHAAVYRRRPDVRAVLHLHAPHAVALSCLREPTDGGSVIPPITPYALMRVGRVPMIEYISPGAPRLAERVAEVCGGVQAILLQNHGVITFGSSIDQAVDIAEELEQACQVWLLTRGEGRLLSPEQISELQPVRP